MADSFIERATSVEDDAPYTVADVGQVLTADGIGGVSWQTPDGGVNVQFAETPPNLSYLAQLASTESDPLDAFFNVNLPDGVTETRLAILWIEVTEYGGENGATINFAPQEGGTDLGFVIEANQPLTRFQAIVPVVNDAFQMGFFTSNGSAIEAYVYFLAAL